MVRSHIAPEGKLTDADLEEITSAANENLLKKDISVQEISNRSVEDVITFLYELAVKEYEEKIKDVPEEVINEFEKAISLRVIDNYWMEQINTLDHLREGIYLRSYGQSDPLREYTMEGFQLFDQMLQRVDKDISIFLLKAEIKKNVERKEVSKKKITNDGKDAAKKKPAKSSKVGRNDPCPCGSGKKYKQCCGK